MTSSGCLPGIFSSGQNLLLCKCLFMLIFLLFSDQISGGQKSPRGANCLRGRPPAPRWKKASLSDKFSSKVLLIRRFEIYTFLFKNCMIRFEIGLEIRHRGVMSLCVIEAKTAVLVVAVFPNIPFVSRPWS